MRAIAACLITSVGCGFQPGAFSHDASPEQDAPSDVEWGEDASINCWGAGLTQVCLTTAPSLPRDISGMIDTDTSDLCAIDVIDATATSPCVIAGTTLTVSAPTTARGARALILLGTASVAINAPVDLASHRMPAARGAGAIAKGDTVSCPAGNPTGPSGGGAGGSFGEQGGGGGNLGGGTAGMTIVPTTLRGGCPGQDGMTGTFGIGGLGGGALLAIAGTEINVGASGVVNASGAAGGPGVTGDAGGGAGGSGGMIAFDAPSVVIAGTIFANGGGGAEGSGNSTAGTPGNEPTGVAAAAGVDGGSNGGPGGNGGAQGTAAGAGGTSANFGGGGGGGGVGVIKVYGARSGAGMISPAPS